MPRRERSEALPPNELPLRLPACSLLYLGLVLATGAGAGSFGYSLAAGSALDLLALFFIGNALGICHDGCCSLFKRFAGVL